MREKFKRFWDTANPDLLRLVIIFVLVGLLLAGFLLFGRSGSSGSVLPAWVQAEHVEPPDERLAAAQKENPDTVAWITIPGTNIDAPVQQYGDNDYYLRRDEKGVKDYHGCIYADYACRMDSGIKVSRNLIFYGHTFTDEDYVGGFEDLHKYRVFEFGQENPYIYVSLANEKLTYQIFSVWVCDANADTDCIQANPDDAAFQQILDKAVAGCAFDYGVDVTTDDHILTLSTCTANAKLADARLTIRDAYGTTIDRWTTTDGDHAIRVLPERSAAKDPHKNLLLLSDDTSEHVYTMVEELAPNGYLVAESITFKVMQMNDALVVFVWQDGGWQKSTEGYLAMHDECTDTPVPLMKTFPQTGSIS